MRVSIRKWGNSLAVHIPRSFAQDIQLTEGSQVDVRLVDGNLVLVPRTNLSLADLLSGVTKENLHAEVDAGAPVGREVW